MLCIKCKQAHNVFRRFTTMITFLWLVMAAGVAHAHDPSLSGIRVLFRQSDVVVNVTTHISRLVRAEGGGRPGLNPVETDVAIRKRLRILIDGKKPAIGQPVIIGDSTNDLLTWQLVVPGVAAHAEVLARLYPEDEASRTLYSEVRDGVVKREALLDAQHPDLADTPNHRDESVRPRSAIALQFLRQGIEHILSGTDHIAFVLGLLLLGGDLKALLKTVTAFTVAHSITLTLAATGVVHPASRIVEPLIALSIVAIAVENLRSHFKRVPEGQESVVPRDLRPFYAFGFGLIHGFGFAGALNEAGLPGSSMAIALASFNIGVECGQAGIVLVAAPVIGVLAARKPTIYRMLLAGGSVVIGLAGAFWFFSRLKPGN